MFEQSGSVVYLNMAAREMLCLPRDIGTLNISDIDQTFAGESGIINMGLVDQGNLKRFTTRLIPAKGDSIIADAFVHKCDDLYVASYQDASGKVAFIESTTAFGLRNEVALDSIPDPIYVLDMNGRWLHANKAALKRFGMNEVDFIDHTSMDLLSHRPWLDDFFGNEENMAREAWASGKPQLTMARAGSPDGDKKDIYQQFFIPNFDRSGRRWLMLVYSRNITAIAEAQELSDERAEMLSSILSNNTVGIALYEEGDLRYGNYSFMNYINNAAENFYHLDGSHASFFKRIHDFIEQNKLKKVDPVVWDYFSREGEHRLLQLEFSSRQSHHGDKVSTTIMLHDVTELMRMEAEQRLYSVRLHQLAEKIEKVQEEERQSLAVEVHDIVGGAATALSMRMGLLKMQLNDVASPEAAQSLDECASLSRSLVNNIRRIVKGLEDVLPADADPNEVLVMYAGRFCGMYGVTPIFEFSVGDWHVDTKTLALLVKIMREAINNAGKHSGCTTITIRAGITESGHFIEVADNGRGMPENLGEEGNGIRQMRRAVDRHNGELRIQSSRGGTSLFCHIPKGEFPYEGR